MIAAGRQRLLEAGFRPADAALDADVLARHVLGWDRAELLVRSREPAADGVRRAFERLVHRRAAREPVALLTGHREFWGLDFLVTPDTLVPRPETEFIVEAALERLPVDAPAVLLDIGTGTGCLAVALARERPALRAIATDISHPALLIARRNADRHGVAARVGFVQADLAAGLATRADVIVSNPPYVARQEGTPIEWAVARYEPQTALFGGRDGLEVLTRLFASAPACLAPGGTLIVEFGLGQETDVLTISGDAGWSAVDVLRDLQGIPRTAVFRR